MKESKFSQQNRREFLTQALPFCAVTCLGLTSLPLLGGTQQAADPDEPKHKFDAELPRKITWAQMMNLQYRSDYIPFLEMLSREMGRDKVIEILKKYSAERGVEYAQSRAKRLGKNDFETLKGVFSPDNPGYKNTLTMTVTENSERVYELKVTECLYAKPWLDAEAGDLGNAAVCHGDYAWAKAFNPEFEMVRDKTLTQGHDCCNHRYLWKG